MKTIKQIADELGVSKDKVKYRVKNLPEDCVHKVDGITYIDDSGINELYKVFGKITRELPGKDSHNTPYNCAENCVIMDTLKEQLRVKDEQISALTAAVAFHAQGMKQIGRQAAGKSGFFARLFGRLPPS